MYYFAGDLDGGGIWPLLANIDLNRNVEPGPRWVGGFSNDFLELSGDVTLLLADVVDELVGVVAADAVAAVEECNGGKGMCDCLLEIDDGEAVFDDVGGVVDDINDFWCCCCSFCCVIEDVRTRGNPMLALTCVRRGPADWR